MRLFLSRMAFFLSGNVLKNEYIGLNNEDGYMLKFTSDLDLRCEVWHIQKGRNHHLTILIDLISSQMSIIFRTVNHRDQRLLSVKALEAIEVVEVIRPGKSPMRTLKSFRLLNSALFWCFKNNYFWVASWNIKTNLAPFLLLFW